MSPDRYLDRLGLNREDYHRRADEYRSIFKSYKTKPDRKLTDEDVRTLSIAWLNQHADWLAYHEEYWGGPEPHLKQGQWFAPIRVTQQELMGDRRASIEFRNVVIADNTSQAMSEARKEGEAANRSWARNVTSVEVLLSGPLKPLGQDKPKWQKVKIRSDQEEETLRQLREAARRQGYRA